MFVSGFQSIIHIIFCLLCYLLYSKSEKFISFYKIYASVLDKYFWKFEHLKAGTLCFSKV